MTRFLSILIIPLLLLLFNYSWNTKSMAFCPENILTTFDADCQRSAISPKACEQIFSQPFTYLGEGSQCYAFVSADGKNVLKLFKSRHMRKKKWLRDGPLFRAFIPSSQREEAKKKWQRKFHDGCARYALAFDEMREEAGLLLLHLAPSGLKQSVQVSARSGKSYNIDLDKVPFILQEKGELVPQRLTSLMQNKPAAVAALVKLHQMLVDRTKRGLIDQRQCLSINFAFVGEKPIQIDVGKIVKEPQPSAEEVEKITQHLTAWTERHFPELAPELEQALSRKGL